MLNWSTNSVISTKVDENQVTTFAINDTKLYVLFVSRLTVDKLKPIHKLKSDFKREINWNKYQSRIETRHQSQYLRLFNWSVFSRNK